MPLNEAAKLKPTETSQLQPVAFYKLVSMLVIQFLDTILLEKSVNDNPWKFVQKNAVLYEGNRLTNIHCILCVRVHVQIFFSDVLVAEIRNLHTNKFYLKHLTLIEIETDAW